MQCALRVGLLLLAWIGFAPAGWAAERIALVIGNSAYQNAPRLSNPASDAKAIAEALVGLGFTVTGPLYDLGKAQMDAALLMFGRQAQASEAVVVFFAGHGLEARGRNYLIPVDASLERDSDASLEAVALEVVLDQIAGPSGYRLVILDACRDNPLANRMQRSDGTRAVYRGLGRIELEGQTYVAYAAKDGTRARDDGGGGHSPFTAALLKYLKEPLPLPNLLGAVREDVLVATQRQQEPWLYGAFGREPVYLTPTLPPPPPQITPSLSPPPPPPQITPSLSPPPPPPQITPSLSPPPVATPSQPPPFSGVGPSPNRQELQSAIEQMMVSPKGGARPMGGDKSSVKPSFPPPKPKPPMIAKPPANPKPAPPMEVSKPTPPKVVSPPRPKPRDMESQPKSQPSQPPPLLY